jgi:hypothetical protein
MIRCLGIRLGKVQKRVLREARYMSTFVVGYLDPTENSQGNKNMTQLHENTGNGNIGEQQ